MHAYKPASHDPMTPPPGIDGWREYELDLRSAPITVDHQSTIRWCSTIFHGRPSTTGQQSMAVRPLQGSDHTHLQLTVFTQIQTLTTSPWPTRAERTMDSIFPKSTLMISGPWRKSKQKSFMKQRPASRIHQRQQPFITIIIFIQNQQEPISKQGVTMAPTCRDGHSGHDRSIASTEPIQAAWSERDHGWATPVIS
ncbi:hypothetical protein ACLOJK_041222 [Asimina triloba]